MAAIVELPPTPRAPKTPRRAPDPLEIDEKEPAAKKACSVAKSSLTALEQMYEQTVLALVDSCHDFELIDHFHVHRPSQFTKTISLRFSSETGQHIGKETTQEDRFLSQTDIAVSLKSQETIGRLYGVFDGSGKGSGAIGDYFVQFLPPRFREILNKHLASDQNDLDTAVHTSFTETFALLCSDYGATTQQLQIASATVVFVCSGRIFCANAGDGRVLLLRERDEIPLTREATLDNSEIQQWHRDRGTLCSYKDRLWAGVKIKERDASGTPKTRCIFTDIGIGVGNLPPAKHPPEISICCEGMGPDDFDAGKVFWQEGDYLVLMTKGLHRMAVNQRISQAVHKLLDRYVPLDQAAQVIAEQAGRQSNAKNTTVQIIQL